jgi:MFS family permease
MSARTSLFLGSFLFSAFVALVSFVLVLYLSSFVSTVYAGGIIAAGALAGILCFPLVPHLERRFGMRTLTLAIATILVCALLVLSIQNNPILSSLLVIIIIALQPFLSYQLDLLIEAMTKSPAESGRVRASFLMVWNAAGLLIPLLLIVLFSLRADYAIVFLAAACALIAFIILFSLCTLPAGAAPSQSSLWESLLCIRNDRDLLATASAHLLIYLFLSFTTLYVPFYLHSILGIPWSTLGWMFSVMLLPYLLLAYPAGWLADRVLGDKELLGMGFIIAGSSLFALGFTSASSSLAFILIILVGSRIGAVLAESMIAGHFFRKISEQDVESIVIYRSSWPLATLLAPVLGSLLLLFGTITTLFFSMGIGIAVIGILITLSISDFR